MKKTTCLTLILLLCTLICGCQRGPTDEELINTTMNGWKQAIVSQDVDAILAGYSEDFSSERVDGKEQMREFMEGAVDQGWLENIDINLEIAQLTITDDTAEFAPVEIIGDNGEMELNFTLKKEDKKTWRIISSGAQR
ncbi:MAG: YybH family protein [Planctomycetota bacterium]